METLKLSSDRKVAPVSRYSPSSGAWVPKIKNAFGLPAHVSCPGATKTCEATCYAFRLERAYTNVAKLLKHNWDLLQAQPTIAGKEKLLDQLILDFRASHDKVAPNRSKKFRIHWDGDFDSVLYAKAWARVIKKNPDIQFWAYTRSFGRVNVVPYLYEIPNLSLYLSVDAHNKVDAIKVTRLYPNVKIASLGTDWADAQTQMIAVASKKAPKCPENTKRYPLVSEQGEGACIQCDLCVVGTNNILFAIDKKV